MNCRTAQGLISAYLDRELAPHDLMNMRAHLATCQSCQKELEALSSLKSMLTCFETPEPAAGFEERLLRAVRTSQPATPVLRPLQRFRAQLVFAGVAACSMLLTLGAINWVNRRPDAPSNAAGQSIAFEVRRDQIYAASADPTMGAPVGTGFGGQ
jgi:predicted anti-sigma-YlaC factor YlaD